MNKNKRTQTETESCETSQTTIKTNYARACIILLALNFCLTGYVMLNVMKLQMEATQQTPVTQSVTEIADKE